jgi:hypothetical protein
MQEFPFYRLATMGWANPLLRQTVTLLRPEPPAEILVDLSRIEFIDSFEHHLFGGLLRELSWKFESSRTTTGSPSG